MTHLKEIECQAILDVLKANLGNRTHTARALGISIRTLRNKLRRYAASGLQVPPPPPQPHRRTNAEIRAAEQVGV